MPTGIAWTDETWNPWQGCTKVSEGCRYCYMYRDKYKLNQDPTQIVRSSDLTFRKPYRLGWGCRVFTCSWSDFFHTGADLWRREAWGIIKECPWIRFTILTKRPHLAAERLPADWGAGYPNVCLGVTAENQERFNERWDALKKIPAAAYVVSHEPALNMIDFPADFLSLGNRTGVIAGGETGPDARPAHLWWIRHDRDQCAKAGVPFFFKSWGEWVPGVKHENSFRLQNRILTTGLGLDIHQWPAGEWSVRLPHNPDNNLLDNKLHNQLPELRIEDPQPSLF